MRTIYASGVSVLWFGQEVFFYVEVEDPAVAENQDRLPAVRLPATADDLPPWTLDLLADLAGRGVDPQNLEQNVNDYLEWFRQHGGASDVSQAALYLLRAINWGELPLHWRPVFLRDLVAVVTNRQSAEAQRQLLHRMGDDLRADPETIAEAVETLHAITGVGSKRRRAPPEVPQPESKGQGL